MATTEARASIVIPAHNESAVISRCLRGILSGARPGEFEIIVACNGCTDDTADIARTFPDATVVEVDTASKVAALNAGDAAATVFPRLYVDADVQISTNAVRAVASVLDRGAQAAAPLPVVDHSDSSLMVRMYFSVWRRLGYATRHALGSGVYGMSESGRSRFGEFPAVIADDGFVYSMFEPWERVNPSGTQFSVRVPRTTDAMLRRRTRIALGNLQLTALTGRTMKVPGPTWRDVVVREPWLLPAVVVYLTVNAMAAARARRRLTRGEFDAWNRDHTSRESVA